MQRDPARLREVEAAKAAALRGSPDRARGAPAGAVRIERHRQMRPNQDVDGVRDRSFGF
jgi:hypothetical protein